VKLRKGDTAGANTDMAAAKAMSPDVAERLARFETRPQLSE